MIYESPDGGKTVYSREPGETSRTIHKIDHILEREARLTGRWATLKNAVFLDDPVINDLIDKIEVLMELKK